MVSAFATGARLILAQQKVDEKSNEITAIPKLLDLLDLMVVSLWMLLSMICQELNTWKAVDIEFCEYGTMRYFKKYRV